MKPAPLIARLLFPKKQPHFQRQYFLQLVAAILIGISVAGLVGMIMFYTSRQYQSH